MAGVRFLYLLPTNRVGGGIGIHTRFKPCSLRVRVPPDAPIIAQLAQLAEAPGLEPGGSQFDSGAGYQNPMQA